MIFFIFPDFLRPFSDKPIFIGFGSEKWANRTRKPVRLVNVFRTLVKGVFNDISSTKSPRG